jgi:hypothetical protein
MRPLPQASTRPLAAGPQWFVDPLRGDDSGAPDSGALPHGAQPWGVGIHGRIPLAGG